MSDHEETEGRERPDGGHAADGDEGAPASGDGSGDAVDGEPFDLYPLPTAVESLTPTQVATMVYGHVKELYALGYDKDKHKCVKTNEDLLDRAATLFLMCFDDRRLSMAMSAAAMRSDIFDTFSSVRRNAMDAQA